MKRFLFLIIILTLPVFGFAKEYIHAAAKIDPVKGDIVGLAEIDGEKKLFNFLLKMADYHDGHTFVIHKKWLPEIPKGYGLKIHINLPEEFLAITDSDRSRMTPKGIVYEYDNPEQSRTLAFSDKWLKETKLYKGVIISTYFTKQNQAHSERYFDRLKELFDLYTVKLGKYPFDSFKVIDVPYPAGHAVKSMTFLSSRIIGMPFLTDVSLGHELVHQWAGVGVKADYDTGNWAEGMTTYLADRLYSQQKGEGAKYRKNALLNYMAHARQKEDGTCLMEFTYNKDKTAQAIGYSKGMMVFSMLESIIGGDNLEHGIRVFLQRNMHQTASWDELINILEDLSGVHLKGFIDGWLADTALAEFSVKDLKVKGVAYGYKVEFQIKNRYKWLEYPLEVKVYAEDGMVYGDYLYIQGEGKSGSIRVQGKPVKMVIDPDYRAARMLTENEAYPSLHNLFSKYPKTVFVDHSKRADYAPVIMTLKNATVVNDDVNPALHMDNILVFLGEGNRAYKKVYRQDVEEFDGQFLVKSIKHPMGLDRMSYLILSKDMKATTSNAHRIRHYGKYSELRLDKGRRYEKKIYEADKGYVIPLMTEEKQGVAVQKSLSIKDIVDANSDKRVFFIGEKHDEYAHHENQYELVKTLVESGHKVAIGFEMFQKPFQRYLTEYIEGGLQQHDMLKKTEYYDRWRYDFRLYFRLVDYAESKVLPLIALNVPQEITKKVAKEGIKSLSEDQLEQIPKDIEYTGGRYKEFLKGIFGMHEGRSNFDNFYEAQLLWDESMAESAYEYIKQNPDKTLVVIAGNGHLRYGEGIPERFKRRSGMDYVLILQDEDYDDEVADYVLYPDEMEYDAAPKIGVLVDETEDGLLVKKVFDGRSADIAGVNKDDYITGFDEFSINDLSDIRIALMYGERGREYKLHIIRGDKDLALDLKL
jgi:uncharacterized iron-regulated protein